MLYIIGINKLGEEQNAGMHISIFTTSHSSNIISFFTHVMVFAGSE